VLTGQQGDPAGFKKEVQEKLTYQPRTKEGVAIATKNPLAYVGRGIDWVGQKAENLIAPKTAGTGRQMLGAGVHEAINQAPGLIGMKAPEAAAAAQAALKQTARNTMQSALKPPIAAQMRGTGMGRPSEAAQAVDTLLNEGINVTRGGMEKMQGRIASLNNDIKAKIVGSNAIVNKQAVAWRLQKVMDDFTKQVTPTSDIAQIQKAWDEFLDHPLLQGNDIPVQLAQELKQGTYKSLGDRAYGELKSAEIEAQKTLARGLKEEIAAAVPEVRKLNAEESKLLNTLSLVERRVLQEANKNPIGLGWLTTSPTKFAGWMADRSPLFKSLVARMLNTASEIVPKAATPGKVAGVSAKAYADAEKERKYQEWKARQEQRVTE